MATHVWKILTCKESLSVRWIHSYKLKGRCFWDVPIHSNISWGWRKILQIRSILRPHIWYKIGNGMTASAWHDLWAEVCPLIQHITARSVTRAGFNLNAKVADVIIYWLDVKWPNNWVGIHPVLFQNQPPLLVADSEDTLMWKTRNEKQFVVSRMWDSIRPRSEEDSWYNIVWHAFSIPRHSLNLWLIMRRKLKTHDLMRQWNVGDSVDVSTLQCSLCKCQPDSHTLVFFDCKFSSWCPLEFDQEYSS